MNESMRERYKNGERKHIVHSAYAERREGRNKLQEREEKKERMKRRGGEISASINPFVTEGTVMTNYKS